MPSTVVFHGDYLEMDVPPDLGPNAPSKNVPVFQLWPQPHIAEGVAKNVCIVNKTSNPRAIRRNEHLCQTLHTTILYPTPELTVSHPSSYPNNSEPTSHQSAFFSHAITVDLTTSYPTASAKRSVRCSRSTLKILTVQGTCSLIFPRQTCRVTRDI